MDNCMSTNDRKPKPTKSLSIINERFINGHLESISDYQIKKIMEQRNKSICKIDGKIQGTGFLCLIPFPDILHLLRVLITCSHVLNDFSIGNEIKLIFGDGKEKILNIDGSRKMYTKYDYDITI